MAKTSEESSFFLFDTLVTILVGSEQHRFDVHKGLLRTKSEFFKAACSENFKEAEGTIPLPSQDVETFKYFIYWLYTGKLSGFYYHNKISPSIYELENRVQEALDGKGWVDVTDCKEYPCLIDFYLAKYRDLPFNGLIDLYVLADFLGAYGLKDMIITALIKVYLTPYFDVYDYGQKRCSNIPFWDHDVERTQWCQDPAKGINLAWETFGENDPLCHVLLNLYSDGCRTVTPFPQGDILNATFIAAAYNRLYDLNWTITAWTHSGAICKHHNHDAGCPLDAPKIDDDFFPNLPS